jgi:hypothetical protein
MSATTYEELLRHVGHDIETITYGSVENVAIECNTCYEVLMDYDNPEMENN